MRNNPDDPSALYYVEVTTGGVGIMEFAEPEVHECHGLKAAAMVAESRGGRIRDVHGFTVANLRVRKARRRAKLILQNVDRFQWGPVKKLPLCTRILSGFKKLALAIFFAK